jgi:cell division inhibitor SulA
MILRNGPYHSPSYWLPKKTREEREFLQEVGKWGLQAAFIRKKLKSIMTESPTLTHLHNYLTGDASGII